MQVVERCSVATSSRVSPELLYDKRVYALCCVTLGNATLKGTPHVAQGPNPDKCPDLDQFTSRFQLTFPFYSSSLLTHCPLQENLSLLFNRYGTG